MVSLLVTTTYVINGERRTVFLDARSRSFFDFSRLPKESHRRTSAIGTQIFLPLSEKACLMSIENTVGASRDTTR